VKKHFQTAEEVIADEQFQAWYYKTDDLNAGLWEQWILDNPSYVPLVQEAIQLLHDVQLKEKEVPAAQRQAAYDRLMQSIKETPVVTMKPRRTRWWVAAAAVLVLMVSGYALWKNMNNDVVMNSGFGKMAQYKLPDGSEVLLNANSQISISENWKEGKDREVWIKGEGFFKVQKTAAKDRFIVHTDKLDVIVTGTQFNVINMDGETSVLLTEGSVTIKTKDGKEIFMKPGDYVRFENNTVAVKPVEEEKVLAWKDAKLDFNETPITEVAKTINRYYGIKVTVADSPNVKTISGIMPNNNLEVLINAIEATGDFRITRTEKEITISSNQ
jgi:transmembrane sensor